MPTKAVHRRIEREYRNIGVDNTRWQRFVSRPGDIIVCTPPKCGTTWMQAIVATLLFPDGAPGPVMEIAPWLDARFVDIDVLVARLDAQSHRRSVKTHTPADGIPWYPSASYIVVGRDGRDACMSLLNHMRNMRPEVFARLGATAAKDGISLGDGPRPPVDDVHDFFAWWLENPMWFDHVTSFWSHVDEQNVLFVHYNDMKADLGAQMRRVASFLQIDVDEKRWPELVERCTFESMKRNSHDISDFSHFVGGADTFLYKGTNDRWRDVLTNDELTAFHLRAKDLMPADAIAWTISGQAALTARPQDPPS